MITIDQTKVVALDHARFHFGLSDEQVTAFEQQVEKDPTDLLARGSLLHEYGNRCRASLFCKLPKKVGRDASESKAKHILWMIENVSSSLSAGDFCMQVSDHYEPENFQIVKDAWLSRVKANDDCLQTKINAALYFIEDNIESRSLAQEVLAKEPNNLWAKVIVDRLGKGKEILLNKPYVEVDQLELRNLSINQRLTERADSMDLNDIALQATDLVLPSVTILTDALKQDPWDLTVRARLLGYTFLHHARLNQIGLNPDLAELRFKNVQWIIENIPGSKFAGKSFAQQMHDTNDANGLDRLRTLWYSAIKKEPENEQILLNASRFLSLIRPQESAHLVHETLRLNADNEEAKRLVAWDAQHKAAIEERNQARLADAKETLVKVMMKQYPELQGDRAKLIEKFPDLFDDL